MAVAYSNPNPNSHHHRHHHHRHQLVSLSPPSVDPQLHRIKLLVSAGGRILPRPSDGALRYAGGQTRVLSLPRHSLTLPDLLHRVSALFSSGAAGETLTLTLTPMSMSLRYQLPDQDLDALVTVSSPDDLDNMLDEFDRLAASAPDPAAARLRLFLFSPSDLPSSFDPDDTGQSYIDAVNGIGPTTRPIQRKDSLVSASSTQNSDAVEASTDNGTSPGLLSPTAAVAEANSQDLSKLETIDLPPYLPQRYPFFNTQPINVVAPNHISSAQNSYKGFQPLPQLPPLPPSYVQLQNVDRYVLQPVVPPALPKGGNGLRLEDCGMCQRALPHAHSDTLINEHGNLSGFVGSASEVSSVLQSYQSEDISRLQAPQSVGSGDISENLGELKIQSSGVAGQVGSHGFTQIPEPVAGTVDHAMVSRPLGGIGVTVETQASHGMFINPQQYRHLDSLQQLPQTSGQPYYLVKQDVVSKQFGSDVGLVKNGISVAEFSYEYVKPIPGMMDSLRVCPYKNSGFNGQQKPAISVPESSYDYARPVDGMMESHRISPTETSGFNGQQKPAIFVLEASYDYARPADAMMESHRISPTETSGFNAQQKPTISVPEVSYDYARPVDGMIESHRINPTETSGSNGQQKSSVSVAEFSYDFARPVDGMEGHRVSPTETSGSNAQQKLGISVPEASYDYAGPVDGVMESGRINPMETLGFNAQQKPSISVPEFAYDNARPADGMEGRRLSPTETSGSNGQHKPAVSMPEVSYDYARPVDGMMECLHVNSTETSGSNCNQKPVVSMPEYSYDFVRHVNGMMEGLRASPSKTSGSNGQQKPAVSVLEYSYDYVRHTDGMEGLHVSPSETLGFNGQQKPTASFPEYSYNYVRPVVGMEGLRVSPSETPAISEQRKPTVPVNPNASMNFQPEKLPLDVENSHTIRQQVGGNSVFLNNAFINSGMASEGSLIRPTYQLAPASLEFTHLQILKPADACHASTVMGNHGPLLSYSEEAKIEARIPSEQLVGFGLSAYSCGPDPVCINNNNIIDKIPIEDDASRVHSKDVLNNIAVPLNRNIQLDYSNSSSTAGHVEQFQELVTSDPLFCNQDPLKGLGSMHMLPSRSNKVSNLVPIVPVENHLVNGKGLDVPVILEEFVFHQQLDLPNKNSHPDPIQPMQDLGEALAQQVVPSFPQSSVFPASSFYSQGKMEPNPLSSKESIYIEDNANSLSQVAPGDQQCQDNKSRQVDKMNLGFPITDDIGHLQIIINSDLEELRELGSGTFGTVYHGKWRGSDVAIKRINDRCFSGKPSEKERMRADFWNEACKLADLHHPNVLAFYGVVLDGPGESFATVTEYMVNGSLRHALQKNDKSLDRRKCLLIAMDVAFGMEYLHGKNIVHFDLKSDNLLVNLRDPQRPICKVGDLGLSKVKCQTLISGGVRGTLPWMAPELLNGSSSLVSEKVDVFSFGIVMWELLTGDEPYADLHYGAIIGGIVNNTLRPPVPESCDPEWRSLMEQCWSADPSGRPSFTEIVNRLRSMAASSPKGSAQTTILN